MKTRNIKQLVVLPCTAEEAYDAWLSSKKHGEMVGGDAKIEAKVGGKFSIWDGEITGKTLELDPEKHIIVQSWRYNYSDWPEDQPSKITLEFAKHNENQCKLLFSQSGIPEKYADEVADGWKEYYWEPMKEYFKEKNG